jgi:GMP synthase-like glutamine amidotransferase
LPGTIPVLHWHSETFDLPAGAVHLVASRDCVNQAFRFGDNAWGLQFHIEATPEMIGKWLAEPVMCADLASAGAAIEPNRSQDDVAVTVFDRWASRIGKSSATVVS